MMKCWNPLETGTASAILMAVLIGSPLLAAPVPRTIQLPQRISAAELKAMQLDVPGSFDIVDLRPPALFSDFKLAGSRNVSIADVIDQAAYVKSLIPLILVDRDGSVAMAVGGILSQRTRRPIRVLHGGLEAYWNDTPSTLPGSATPALHSHVAPVPLAPLAPSKAAPASSSVPVPAKKSAGC